MPAPTTTSYELSLLLWYVRFSRWPIIRGAGVSDRLQGSALLLSSCRPPISSAGAPPPSPTVISSLPFSLTLRTYAHLHALPLWSSLASMTTWYVWELRLWRLWARSAQKSQDKHVVRSKASVRDEAPLLGSPGR
eukprot:2673245-Rhodomonas_salina.3